MKYVSFTFDDGRRDNFTCAYPVMKKYGIPGTLFCTTGYIDGTWQKDESWHSAGVFDIVDGTEVNNSIGLKEVLMRFVA